MKRKSVVALSTLLIASSLLASCGGGSNKVSFGAYWYKNSSVSSDVGVVETLTYNVSFDPKSGVSKNYNLDYANGEYVTTFGLVEENGKTFYRLSSSLTIDVTYTFNNSDVTFTDTTVSIVDFEKNNALTPIKSEKHIVSHSPLNQNEKSDVSGCYSLVDYSVSVVYNGASGVSTIVNNRSESTKTHEFEIRDADDYTYIDNEQLYLALRGLQPVSAPSSLLVYAPFSKAVQEIQVAFGSKQTGGQFTYVKNDATEATKNTMDYYDVTIGLSGQNPGSPQTIRIAATSDPKMNTNRNVILSISTPLSYNLGTLKYELKSAQLF